MKRYVLLALLLISTFLLTIKFNYKEENIKEINKIEEILSKPNGIQAYTLNGEKTDLSYNDLISGYVVDTITCKNGTIATFNKTDNSVNLSNIHMPDYCTMDFRYTIYGRLLADNKTIKTRTDFNTTFTETNTGTLYKSTESIAGSTPKDVYYFAGNAQNNWVKFAGYYWRIVRTNHDGSVRLLYAGTSPDTTEGYIGKSTFNTESNSPKYVGYMYGNSDTTLNEARTNTNDSTIKTYIDNWYSNNLSAYTKYLSIDAVYCNNRKAPSYSASDYFMYYVYTRLNAGNPTYDCEESSDAFSRSTTGGGNVKLTYPIGLMTADEITYAGGYNDTSLTSPYAWYYLNSAGGSITGSTYWWLLSPAGWNGNSAYSWFVAGSDHPGNLNCYYAHDSGGVRPAISLKGNLVWKSGNGGSASPYEVEDLPPTLAETIKSYSTSHTNGVYNENGYRYEGSDPSNYIYMTNKSTNEKELWRIIGVFNDGVNGEEIIRVRRHYEKNNFPEIAYDTNGKNHFPESTIYSKLSSTYNLTNYSYTVNYKLHLGTSSSPDSLTSSGLYSMERGNVPGTTAKNNYNGSTSFIGSVGLMYPSDYGYGVLASDCVRTIELYNYNVTATCHDNNWLYHGNSQRQRLISPSASNINYAFTINPNGSVYADGSDLASYAFASSPVMALSKDVLVTGSGTKTDPYMLVN